MALKELRSARLRSALTMSVVVIGVALFVTLSSVIDGFKNTVNEQVESLGDTVVTITPGQRVVRDEDGNVTGYDFSAAFGLSTLTDRDLESVSEIKAVSGVAPQMLVSGVVEYQNSTAEGARIIATSGNYAEIMNQDTRIGKFFTSSNGGDRVVVLGSKVAEQLFNDSSGVGAGINVRDKKFTVIGVLDEFNQSTFNLGLDLNNSVFIPFEQGKKFNDGAAAIYEISLALDDDVDVDQEVARIEEKLLVNHGSQRDFSVVRQSELQEVTNTIANLATLLSAAVSLLILFVAGIVIFLIMLVVVNERVREIGIRKAVGAPASSLVWQFLTEATLIGIFGSVIGVGVGLAGAYLIGTSTQLDVFIDELRVIQAATTGIVVSILGGFIPAYRASRRDPIESLRH